MTKVAIAYFFIGALYFFIGFQYSRTTHDPPQHENEQTVKEDDKRVGIEDEESPQSTVEDDGSE